MKFSLVLIGRKFEHIHNFGPLVVVKVKRPKRSVFGVYFRSSKQPTQAVDKPLWTTIGPWQLCNW